MSKPKIKPEDFLNDIDEILKIASNINNLNLENTDIKKLTKRIKKSNKLLKNKYKNLDTEK